MFKKRYGFVAMLFLLFLIIGSSAAVNQDITNDGTFNDVQDVIN